MVDGVTVFVGLTDTACGGAELFSLMHMRSLFCVKTSNFPNSFRSPLNSSIDRSIRRIQRSLEAVSGKDQILFVLF